LGGLLRNVTACKGITNKEKMDSKQFISNLFKNVFEASEFDENFLESNVDTAM
jgi:hypothetical protein